MTVTPIRTRPCIRCGTQTARWLVVDDRLCYVCAEFADDVNDRIEVRAIQTEDARPVRRAR